MKKILFYLITVFIFLPAFVVATDVDKGDDVVYKTFEVKTDNGIKYSIKCPNLTDTPSSYLGVFRIENDKYNLTVRDVADYYKSIDYEKYSVEKIKNGFTILYDKAERIKFMYDLNKKVWTITLNGANSTSKYSVEFNIIESNNDILFDDVYRWGEGTKEERQRYNNNKKIFSKIKVAYNDEQYYDIPLSAYSDMADMHRFHLNPVTDGFELRFEGGDTAEHYIANLIFKKGFLIRKEVRNSEFYDDVWEQTFYSYNDSEN